ncbi:similar to mitochondrial inner membrane protein OXA1 [Cyanidioschyzon merolae strain 10D]|jgi:YidC/Oxa1 family membrane protein insertase|uniref:Similar to mitochondrial inner membrane protein OXA1 n=1 Tax=Cyanidioschyzon merolae (strain NIES-3377 / 10D) TaxID=280699 RepID=M1V6L4_CYAM1|nr:similar to mitochondrial inner membrane protein OXA1 [Cyanidioschyzon merolae strain 10D]BAM79044.1 similar to mitochondrial inner membrane protein OXA1 [Cyanidioschyzon merolae strain 10D]|eukprot:XP_005535330.1 similar to mitochondrial inner membrane protein OXA1 [Cyanidioschyzon merolae strain 10D]
MLRQCLFGVGRLLSGEQGLKNASRFLARGIHARAAHALPVTRASTPGATLVQRDPFRRLDCIDLGKLQVRRLQSESSRAVGRAESATAVLGAESPKSTGPGTTTVDSEATAKIADDLRASSNAASTDLASEAAEAALSAERNWYDPVVQGIIMFQEYTDLPWWATVAAVTVLARILVLPLTLNTFRNAARMQSIKPDVDAIKERMQAAMHSGDQQRIRALQQQVFRLLRENQISPLRSLVNPLVQMPLFISFFLGLRKIAKIYPDELRNGGLGWFRDLSLPDPFYGLPALTSATMLFMIQMGTETGGAQLPPFALNLMRIFALILLPLTAQFPAILFCYWLPNNLFSMLQAFALRHQRVRRWLGCPPLGARSAAATAGAHTNRDAMPDAKTAAIRSYLRSSDANAPVDATRMKILESPPQRSAKAR